MRTTSEASGTTLNTPTFESYEFQKTTKKKGHEKILEKIIAENFPNLGKGIVAQVQEAQRVQNRIKPR